MDSGLPAQGVARTFMTVYAVDLLHTTPFVKYHVYIGTYQGNLFLHVCIYRA